MSTSSLDQITMEALQLPPESRETLAYRLLQSLNEAAIDPEILNSWIQEADRREEELESGKVQAIPAEEVFRKLREKYG